MAGVDERIGDASGPLALRRLSPTSGGPPRSDGRPLRLGEVLVAGWPEESIAITAARNRVYVAISTLRSLGLTSLERVDTGWCFDPDVPQVRAHAAPVCGEVPSSLSPEAASRSPEARSAS